MFKPLGLFGTAQCPDKDCRRPYCFFQHGGPSRAPAKAAGKVTSTSSTSSPKSSATNKRESSANRDDKDTSKRVKQDVTTKTNLAPKQPGNRDPTLPIQASRPQDLGQKRQEPSVVARNASAVKPAVRNISSTATGAAGKPATEAASSGAIVTLAGGVPRVPKSTKLPPQPYPDRQKGMQTLFTQYSKLYSQISVAHPNLAAEHTLAQEAEISASSPNVKAYKTAIHHAAVSISRRPVPDSLAHTSIGTVKESREKVERAEKEAAGKLTRRSVERYCLPLDEFEAWRYPNPNDPALLSGGDEAPDGEGERHPCSRCKLEFVVSSKQLKERFGECRFHHGRVAPERIDGRRKWIYTCCRKERGEPGCEDGIHVFSEKEDDAALARRVGFKTVKQVVDGAGVEAKGLAAFAEVVAMDCEMIYTTAGSSLARVTIVDTGGNILVDELVRQTVPVLDLNMRYSGITAQDLAKAVMDLPAVRAACCMFIGPNTIIVGHGLENDLRALRLLHDKVIDTAVVFPHEKGRPFRRALRDIVKEKLGVFIQDRTADLGHSSAEDAQSTLEVLKWKVRDDAD